MLTPEQADLQLKSFLIPEARERAIVRCQDLPPVLRELGFWFVDGESQSEARKNSGEAFLEQLRAYSKSADPRDSGLTESQFALALQYASSADRDSKSAFAVLETVSPDVRMRFFEALFPKLAPALDSAWKLTFRSVYQSGWSRPSFRAPSRPEVTRDRRCEWLRVICTSLSRYDPDANWCTVWAGHLARYGTAIEFGILLAGAIELGDVSSSQVFDILAATIKSEHETAVFGRHVAGALMLSSREDGWTLVEKMLLAAQRQEGLRQSILESVDESHPWAFRRMLRLIVNENLIRFSATVRAIAIWFGLNLESATPASVEKIIARALEYLDDRPALEKALGHGSGEDAYLALWALAYDDIAVALPRADCLLNDKKVERRFAAVYLLGNLQDSAVQPLLVRALQDEDLRVAAAAFAGVENESAGFRAVETFIKRLPEGDSMLGPLIWPWTARKISIEDSMDRMPHCLGERPPSDLIPYLSTMGIRGRRCALIMIGEQIPWRDGTREVMLRHLSDPSPQVRESVFEMLGKAGLHDGDSLALEKLMTRKSGDLRQGVLKLLSGQTDDLALASAKRLLALKDNLQRLAGLELLNILASANRKSDCCHADASAYKSARKVLSADEKQLLGSILKEASAPALTLENALGLLDPAQRTPPAKPRVRAIRFYSQASVDLLVSLDAFIHENREVEVPGNGGQGEATLLGAVRWFNIPYQLRSKPVAEQLEGLPLRSLWDRWLRNRDANLRDPDGFELMRAIGLMDRWYAGPRPDSLGHFWHFAFHRLVPEHTPKLQYEELIKGVLPCLQLLQDPEGLQAPAFLLDAVETLAALIPPDQVFAFPPDVEADGHMQRDYVDPYAAVNNLVWREGPHLENWVNRAVAHLRTHPQAWNVDYISRLYCFCRWWDEPTGEGTPKFPVPRARAPESVLRAAYRAGIANKADLLDDLLGPRDGGRYASFNLLREATARKPSESVLACPDLIELAGCCRERIMHVELARGDLQTVASDAAVMIGSVWGINDLIRLLVALGSRNLVRSTYNSLRNKEGVLSYLIRVSWPNEKDSATDFARAIEKAGIAEKRLIELSIFAPQWAKFIEYALNWKGLEDAVWWIRAHTKDRQWSDDADLREEWNAEVSERTPLSGDDLMEGGVDVEWFNRCFEPLGEKRWAKLSDAAKFSSEGTGHTRAQLFSAAMLGHIKKSELLDKIKTKRNQDSVRSLGLLPVAGGKNREKDVLDRYQVLQEFIRSSRQFGSMRQESEKRAARIGQQNLARSAGFSDPLRLQWAMEARAVADLADGPISLEIDGVVVKLQVDTMGEVSLTATKGGQIQKVIPARLKKDKSVAELRKRSTELRKQASRIRNSLEDLMIRGDKFSGAELRDFMQHPLLKPLLCGLVLVGGDGLGYPDKNGASLVAFDDSTLNVDKTEQLRIAHPHDLLRSKKWHLWQKDCFAKERIQPFKQIFRELYVLTAQEQKVGSVSHRYAGQQVNPKQAIALLGARGWVARYDEGVRKTFHAEGLTANLTFTCGAFTPLEMEGLTVDGVQFYKRNDWHAQPLNDITPRIFSEVMRDLDLVVSVAHLGGVDPEASASTTEMRAALLREALPILKIKNVRYKENHVLIDGALAHYSVHLGSGNVHLLPGGSLCLVAIHAQHRGRLFLPFADNDPKTAEVLSKVLMLARDHEIKDPQLLDQIRERV